MEPRLKLLVLKLPASNNNMLGRTGAHFRLLSIPETCSDVSDAMESSCQFLLRF